MEEQKRLAGRPDYKSTFISYLRNEWEDYMIYGGYPAIITESGREEKIDRLREIRDSFVKRDILESGIKNESAFYKLFRILAAQTGSLVNVNELSSTLRIKNETVINYLKHNAEMFSYCYDQAILCKYPNELIKMPKVFMLDTGLRNCLTDNFLPVYERTDRGDLWENTFFRVLADKLRD